ncbi:MAG: DUF1214 domain-containing protein [Hyphomicrobiaceae bacterium]|nr:DUF1214 domain-containing protein [Hyphomicrobiaceae bacterium]
MTYRLYVLKQALLNGLRSISDWALFVGVILIGGIGSHWYMVEAGSGLSVERDGAWVAWSNAGRNDNDPYARAHFARLGVLPPSSDIARTYIAREDSEGTKLHSSCDYAIESGDFKSRWWSITVFDSDGALVRNAAGRHAYSRDTVAMGNDGNFVVTLSRDARPGNWLPTGGAGNLAIMLLLQDGTVSLTEHDRLRQTEVLPEIVRIKCR